MSALDELTLPVRDTPSLWVVSGNCDSMLDRLRTDNLNSLGIRVVAPTLDSSEQHAPQDVRDKVVNAFGQAVQLVDPVLGLVVALGDLAETVFNNVRSASTLAEVSPHRILWDTIAAASKDQPAAIVLGGVTDDGLDLIWSVVSNMATRLPERPVLFVLGAQGPPDLRPEAGRDPIIGWSPVLAKVRAAAQSGRARWNWIPPLNEADVQEWVGPLEVSLAQRLVAVSGGDSMIAARRWQQWRAKGYIEWGERGVWAATGAAEPFEADLHSVLAQRVGSFTGLPIHLEPISVAADALDLAALCGTAFSASAVAGYLGETLGVDVTIIEDLLDEITPGKVGLPSLIDTTDHVRTGDGVDHWLYGFASIDFVTYLRRRARDLGVDTAVGAGELLESLHRCHHRLPLFDAVARELARESGDSAAAFFYSHRIEAVARDRQLLAYAAFLRSLPDSDLDVFVLDDLSRTANDLRMSGYLTVAMEIAQRAFQSADVCGAASQKAEAARALGLALDWAGLSAQATGPLSAAVVHHRRLSGSEPANRTYQRNLAIGLWELGTAQREAGHAALAIASLTESVTLYRRLHDSEPINPMRARDLAMGLADLGVAQREAGHAAAAIASLTESVTVRRRLRNSAPSDVIYQRDLAVGLGDLGDSQNSVGQAAEATASLIQAVALHRELHESEPTNPAHRRDLAVRLKGLGVAQRCVGHMADAIASLTEAVTLHRELHDSERNNPTFQCDLAIGLGELGAAQLAAGRAAEGIASLTEAVAHLRQLHDSEPTNPTHRHNLAIAEQRLAASR